MLSTIDDRIKELEAQLLSLQTANIQDKRSVREEIGRLEDQVRTLKSTRNTLIPIARLHDDLLQEIFVISLKEFFYWGKITLLTTWICRSWRDLAIQTSDLWTHINFLQPDWVKMALSRISGREIHLSFNFGMAIHLDKITSICVEDLHLTHTLAITPWMTLKSSLRELPPVSPAWITPAPRLVELSLHCFRLPPNLFSHICPSLRSISLDSCEFSWSSIPAHAGITHFSITSPTTMTSIDDIVTRIRVIGPTLRELRLSSALLPSPPRDPGSQQIRTYLPEATLLELTDMHASHIAFFLDQVALLELTNIDIGVSEGELGDVETMASALAGARGLNEWDASYVRVGLDDYCLTLRISEEWEEDTGVIKIDFETYINFRFHLSNVPAATVLSALHPLPLKPVEDLRLVGNGDYDDHGSELANHFHLEVRFLEMTIDFVPTFTGTVREQNRRLRQLANVDDIPDIDLRLDYQTVEAALSVMTFPQLQHLSVVGDQVTENRLGRGYFLEFREWLAWRKILGLQVNTVAFVYLKVPKGVLIGFEDLVDEFHQTGVEEIDEGPSASPFDVDLRMPPPDPEFSNFLAEYYAAHRSDLNTGYY